MNGTYINPLSDIFMLYLLGKEENADLLLDFINSVLLDADFDVVKEAKVKNPFNIKNFKYDKSTVLDVKAVDENNRVYNIEVQIIGNEIFANRSLYYWAKLYSGQLRSSKKFDTLKPVICINLLGFNLFKEVNHIHNCFVLTERRDPELVLTDHLQIHFIENKKLKELASELKSDLKIWLEFLSNEGKVTEEKMTILLKDKPILKKAHNEYDIFTKDDYMREVYETKLKREMDNETYYGKLIENAKKQGIEKGIERGKLEDARNFKRLGVSNAIIAQATGLSLEQIEKL